MTSTDWTKADDVLLAFHEACPLPTATDLAEWSRRHPDHADALAAQAEAMRRDAARAILDRNLAEESAEELALKRAREACIAKAMAGLYGREASLADMLDAAKVSVAEAAARIGIGRTVLLDIIAGRMVPEAPLPFLQRLAAVLGGNIALARSALSLSYHSPRIGYASATEPEAGSAASFAEVVSESDTTEEQKAFWLEAE